MQSTSKMPLDENIHIPIDSNVLAEQRSLHHDVTENQRNCEELKNFMLKILLAAKPSKSDESSKSSSSSDSSCTTKSFNTRKSIKSIHSISSDGKTINPDVGNHEHDTPSLDDCLSMATRGELDFSDEVMKELYAVNTRVDTLNAISNNIQGRWSELDSSINRLKKDIISIKQYQKIDNLLLHNFILPSNFQAMTSLEFSDYVAKQLNTLLPNLPLPVDWQHISTAHYLPTKSKKSVVVVVRFCNRNIKDMECNKVKELFGPNVSVCTESCKVYVDIDGKSNRVRSIDDVHKLFVNFCERIGSDDNYVFSNSHIEKNHSSPYMKHHSTNRHAVKHKSNIVQGNRNTPRQAVSFSNRTFFNSNRRPNFNSNRRKVPQGGYQRKPNTHYSVHNRSYN